MICTYEILEISRGIRQLIRGDFNIWRRVDYKSGIEAVLCVSETIIRYGIHMYGVCLMSSCEETHISRAIRDHNMRKNSLINYLSTICCDRGEMKKTKTRLLATLDMFENRTKDIHTMYVMWLFLLSILTCYLIYFFLDYQSL